MEKHGKLIDGVIVYAPKHFDTAECAILNPSDEMYLSRGWKKIVDVEPPTFEGYYAVAIGWEEDDITINRIYEMREIVKPPRRWTPLSIKRAADDRGWWSQLRAALVSADLLEEFWGCQYIAEDDPKFPEIKAGMDALFGVKKVIEFLDTVQQEVYR